MTRLTDLAFADVTMCLTALDDAGLAAEHIRWLANNKRLLAEVIALIEHDMQDSPPWSSIRYFRLDRCWQQVAPSMQMRLCATYGTLEYRLFVRSDWSGERFTRPMPAGDE